RRLLRGIGRALRPAVPGSDRGSLGPLGLLAFASGGEAAHERNDFFRIVAAHCRPRRASRSTSTRRRRAFSSALRNPATSAVPSLEGLSVIVRLRLRRAIE